VNLLRVTSLQIGQEVRTNWPSSTGSLGGTAEEIATRLNVPIWDSAIAWKGQFNKAQMQVDAGTADVHVVRAAWNDAWGSCTTINTLRVTAAGVEDSSWVSAWASNDYRIGIVITNSESARALWRYLYERVRMKDQTPVFQPWENRKGLYPTIGNFLRGQAKTTNERKRPPGRRWSGRSRKRACGIIVILMQAVSMTATARIDTSRTGAPTRRRMIPGTTARTPDVCRTGGRPRETVG
jgi:hypothetical protein